MVAGDIIQLGVLGMAIIAVGVTLHQNRKLATDKELEVDEGTQKKILDNSHRITRVEEKIKGMEERHKEDITEIKQMIEKQNLHISERHGQIFDKLNQVAINVGKVTTLCEVHFDKEKNGKSIIKS